MLIALLAAISMVATDILGTVMVMAEAAGRGWLAGIMDTLGWLVSITTLTISVTALQGHSWTEKTWVVGLVSLANLFGTKAGQMIGSHLLKNKTLGRGKVTLEDRVAALESHTYP